MISVPNPNASIGKHGGCGASIMLVGFEEFGSGAIWSEVTGVDACTDSIGVVGVVADGGVGADAGVEGVEKFICPAPGIAEAVASARWINDPSQTPACS
ncbi:MAG: hypothetical protein ACWA5W_03145, partial [Phycisphaerales bacterium]